MVSVLLQRELYIAFTAQPLWLRIVKFPVLLLLLYFAWKKKRWKGVFITILIVLVVGVLFHFFLRYMTHGWTEAWWIVPKITTPYD